MQTVWHWYSSSESHPFHQPDGLSISLIIVGWLFDISPQLINVPYLSLSIAIAHFGITITSIATAASVEDDRIKGTATISP